MYSYSYMLGANNVVAVMDFHGEDIKTGSKACVRNAFIMYLIIRENIVSRTKFHKICSYRGTVPKKKQKKNQMCLTLETNCFQPNFLFITQKDPSWESMTPCPSWERMATWVPSHFGTVADISYKSLVLHQS